MFSTSGDILNWVLLICAIALTFFLCWGIYYFVVATHKFYRVIKRVEKGVTKAEEILDLAKDKIKTSATYMTVFGEIAKQAVNFVQEKKAKKRAKATANTKKK